MMRDRHPTRLRRASALPLLAGALLAVATPRAALAQEVDPPPATLTGSWAVSIESPEGVFEFSLDLEQHEDGTLTGVTRNDMIGEAPLDAGWVDGDAFGFMVTIDAQGQIFEVLYEGTFAGDEMFGSLDAGGGTFLADFTGVRSGGAR